MRDLFGVADVHDFADGFRSVEQAQQGFDGVAHVAEAARLFSVAVNLDGRIVESGFDEIGKHHAVAAGLARPDGVEEADDDDGEMLFLPVREREKFVERLGCGVAPAAFGGGAEDEVGVFVERHVGVFAVDLGRGSDEDELLFLVGGFENHLRAVDVGLDGANGAFDDELHADGGGEVNHSIGVIDELGDELAILDIVEVILHAVEGFEVADVVHAAGGEIVEQHDVVAAIEQALRQMRADEAGTASNQKSQKSPRNQPE